jgi:hypothetical protein
MSALLTHETVSQQLCLRLTGKAIPRWVNRLASYGSTVSCCLPKKLGVPHPDSADVQSQVHHSA